MRAPRCSYSHPYAPALAEQSLCKDTVPHQLSQPSVGWGSTEITAISCTLQGSATTWAEFTHVSRCQAGLFISLELRLHGLQLGWLLWPCP